MALLLPVGAAQPWGYLVKIAHLQMLVIGCRQCGFANEQPVVWLSTNPSFRCVQCDGVVKVPKAASLHIVKSINAVGGSVPTQAVAESRDAPALHERSGMAG